MQDNETPADLDAVRRGFESLGRTDPMYAALTRKGYEGNRWDPAAFFENGSREIADVMERLDSLGIRPRTDRALDFGCAVGRLTQALAEHFDKVVGVDIAASMIEGARNYNRYGERVSYVVNTTPDLRLFADASFDFIYSNKVLQHIPPAHQLTFIGEFIRLLRPGGLAVFQTRNGPPVRPGTLRALLYTLKRVHFRRISQKRRRRPPYEMHYVARLFVERTVAEAGGSIVVGDDLSAGRPNRSLRYTARR